MSAVPQQVLTFLGESAPFDTLSDSDLGELARHASLIYLTQDNVAELIDKRATSLYLIANGQFTVHDCDGPVKHLSEGDYFNLSNILNKYQTDTAQQSATACSPSTPLSVSVDQPGLIYQFAGDSIASLLQQPAIFMFFSTLYTDMAGHQAIEMSNSMWLYRPLLDVINNQPVSVDHAQSIQAAAMTMADHNVSSVLVTKDNLLTGIVTDRDLRNRVVAHGCDISAPVTQIMTAQPTSISDNRTLFDAMALMSEKNIHHLPVVNQTTRQPVGMLTATDLIRLQRSNVLFVIGALAKASNLYELTAVAWQIPHYFASAARRPGDFDIAGKVLSQATDIMTRRLLAFYEADHGPAPMHWCWLAYGSQAREDQTMGSDQDNSLLLARQPDAAASRYFAGMSHYVCQGLAKCGIRLCEGNIMASNPALRQSVDQAYKEAQQWVNQPTPAALLKLNIFLDVRAVAGHRELLAQLHELRMPLFKRPLFLAALVRSTNDIAVPLSLFQKFVYHKQAAYPDSIDIKVNAVAIINNLVRVYALASQISTPGTLPRLAGLPKGKGLSVKDAENLRDIWLFLGRLRWRHQLTNSVTDNRVRVSQLSSIEKHQLKAAFKAIERAQQAAVLRFAGGMG